MYIRHDPRMQVANNLYRQVVPRYGTRLAAAAAGGYYYYPQIYKGAKKLYNYYQSSPKPSAIRAKNAINKSIRARRVKTFPKKIKSQIKELKKIAESDMGTLTYRDRAPARLLAGVNAQAASAISASDTTILESVIAQLRYYDPSAPTALVTADGASGSYQKEFFFKRTYSKITLRNNYQTPCHVKVYCCKPKEDTNITPFVAWTNGLTDMSNGLYSDTNVFPTDSPQFTDLYKTIKSESKLLNPGQEMVCSNSMKEFQYDPSLTDSHNLTYQTRNKNFLWMIVVQGVIAHDTTLDEQGLIACGVDIVVDRVFEVRYSAGADIKYVYVTDSLDTFTNGAVYSSRPVSDNIGYSVA